jgi:hypothetical protein
MCLNGFYVYRFSMTYSAVKKRRGGRGKGLALAEGLVASGPDVCALHPVTRYKCTNYRQSIVMVDMCCYVNWARLFFYV